MTHPGRAGFSGDAAAMQFVGTLHTLAYPFWLGLLAARMALLVTLLVLPVADLTISHARAASKEETRAARQASLDDMLTIAAASNIASFRTSCAAGRSVAGVARSRSMNIDTLPDAVELCITALIRTARDGNLGYLKNADGNVTPALALDTGFVAGYGKAGSPSALPALDALRSKAESCLSQTMTDNDLCYSIGYVYGIRAANGETMKAR